MRTQKLTTCGKEEDNSMLKPKIYQSSNQTYYLVHQEVDLGVSRDAESKSGLNIGQTLLFHNADKQF